MPTRDTPWPNGTPCWVDHGASDLETAQAFYASVLGWEHSGGEPEFGGYLTVLRNGRMAGGMGPQLDPDDPHRWTTLDPQGNAFGLWQSGLNTGVQIHHEPGALAWNEAMVDDTAGGKEFHSAVFGSTFEQMSAEMAEGADDATSSAGGDPLGGLGAWDPSMPKGWLTCFSVASTDEAVPAVEANGGTVTRQPMDTPFGRSAVVEDPWGAPFEVMQEAPA